jgi:hypothetical protein
MLVNGNTLTHEYCHGVGLGLLLLIRWLAKVMAAYLTHFLK